MKLKTFILTFLMMSSSFLFGQKEMTVGTMAELQSALDGTSGFDLNVTLENSFLVTSRIEINSQVTATLDLNGYTLSADKEIYVLNNLGKLTIKDSNGGGTIEGRGVYNGYHGSVDETDLNAELTIYDGIFKNLNDKGGAAVYNLGTAHINGGEFYGAYAAIHNRLAVMYIENAYIEGHTTNNYGDFRNSGSLYINENVYFYGKYSEEKTGSHTGEFKYVVAKIGNAYFATLQDAINKAVNGDVINIVADCAGDVTVTQAPDYAITINGNDKTFKGTITVDGKSARYETTALTIQNVNFDATEDITYDACVNLGVSGNNNTRYTNNVTVKDCTFSGNGAVAVKSYTGGDWNLRIEGCTVNEGMHSLVQVTNVEKGLEITNCKVYSKNGINLNNSGSTDVVKIENNIVDVTGYAVRIGVNGNPGTNAQDLVLANNTLKSACEDGDAVIMFRGTATKANFSMEKNVVSGTTHISGTTKDTNISADANYWDGKSAPVVAEGSTAIVVNSYYADEELTELERNEMGTISAFVMADRLTGDVKTNASESLIINILGKDGNVIGTTSCEKAEHMTGFNKLLTWRINLGADDSGSWAMRWNEGAPSINNMPAKVEVIVDGEKVAESDVKYVKSGDGNDPVFAAKTDAEGKILSFIACTGKFNLNDASTVLNNSIIAGDNVAIIAAGTYNVPTGKDVTITGAVDGVVFDMANAVGVNSSMTFNNVTFNYGNANYVDLQQAGTMTYNNCTFNGQVFLYGTSETFNNCTFNQTSNNAYNVWTYGAQQVAFNECTFNSAGKSVLIYAEGANIFNDVTVTECQFNASEAVEGKAAIEMDSSLTAGINLTIEGETTATGFADGNVSGNSLWNNKKGNADNANNDITVVVDGETVLAPIYVAQIGETKHRTLQLAIDAVQNGETIKLLDDIDEEVHINNSNVKYIIDGKISETENVVYSGVIEINVGQNVTIKNIDFKTSAEANHDFITNAGSPTGKNYNTTLLVEDCNFKGNLDYDVVAVRTTHPTHTQIINCKGTDLHSLLQNTGGQKVTVEGVTVNSKEGGLALGGVRTADVKNSDITANGYGVRVDAATANAVFNIESTKVNAFIPVVVRKASAQNVQITFSGKNTMTQSNADGYWCVIGKTEYEENGKLPEAGNGKVVVTLADAGLSYDNIYGNYYALPGEGTKESPYLINDIFALKGFRDAVNSGDTKYNADGVYVALGADIDLNNEEWTVGIGDGHIYSFDGIFDGKNHVIKNFNMKPYADKDGYICGGLFGFIYGNAVVKNFTMENVTINTGDIEGNNVAAVVGFAYEATGSVEYVTVKGDVKIDAKDVTGTGAIVGYEYFTELTVKDCVVSPNEGSYIKGAAYVGGIIGYATVNVSVENNTIENVSIIATSCAPAGVIGVIDGGVNVHTDGGVVANSNTVKNVALTVEEENWLNSAAIAVGCMAYTNTITVSNTTFENVTANDTETDRLVGSLYAYKPTTPVAKVPVKIGDTYYTTLQKAIDNVQNDQTITLLDNIDYVDYVYETGKTTAVRIPNGKDFTLDLNGCVISGENSTENNYELITIEKGAKLIVDDTSENKTGVITYEGTRTTADGWMHRCHTIFNQGTLVLNNGKIENTTSAEKEAVASAIDNNASWGKEGYLTVNGGTVVSTSYYAVRTDVNTHNTTGNGTMVAKVEFNGGTIYGHYLMDRGNDINKLNDIDFTVNENAVIEVCAYNGQALRFRVNAKSEYEIVISDEATINGTVIGLAANIGNSYFATLQDAVDNVKEGDNTINLLADVNENVTVSQVEGINIVIDGKEHQFNGQFVIDGNSRNTGAETLTIQNVNFYTENTSHDFISANTTDSETRYAHNVTVKYCNFTTSAENTNNAVVGMRFRQAHNIKVENCNFNNMFLGMWATGTTGITLNKVKSENCGEGGFHFGPSTNIVVENAEITAANGYGIRVDASVETTLTVNNSNITANVPVVARNASANYNINFYGTNTMVGNNPYDYYCVIGTSEYKGGEELPTAPAGTVIVTLNDANLSYDGVYGNFAVAKVGSVQYTSFEAALNAVEDGQTITLFNITASELSKEIEFTKDIEFTIEGTAPNYELPVITFQNATVNIKNAEILIPELDARQNATINVINSTVYSAGGNGIVKSYYNGAINIDVTSTVYTMQVTTMGYITVAGTLNATCQTNVYGNGLITLNKGAEFNTAALQLTAKDYNGRDNTDAERVGKPAEIVVNGADLAVGRVKASNGADYSYNSSYGINIGTIEGKSAILNVKNGEVEFFMADGQVAKIGAGGTVNLDASTLEVACSKESGNVTLVNNGSIVLESVDAKVTSNECGNVTTTVAYHKVKYDNGSYIVVERDYVAQIYDVNGGTNLDRRYESFGEAATLAQHNETIKLLWEEGDASIAMAATFVGNKTVTITGTANVDWSKGWFYVGRNGEGDGHVIFNEANLTSTSNSTSNGFNVSGSKMNDENTNNGTIEIINSNIVLDYMLNKGTMSLNNSILKVKNGFSVTGRKASESATGEDATATMTLSNNSKVIVDNMNGMGIGHEAFGVMTIDATSTFEALRDFNVAVNGTMNVNGGNVILNGNTLNVNGTLNSAGNITGDIVNNGGTIRLTGGIYTTEPGEGWCAENYGAFPYDENSWIVREVYGEQTIALTSGWNWMSSYISDFDTEGLSMLTENLGDNGVQIKNNLGSLTNGGSYYGWYGTLNTVSVNEMYKVNVNEAQTITLQGNYVNYDECVIPLYKGWNYIGYPVNERMSLADALAKLEANEGDVIKSQNATAIYTEEEGWICFGLDELVPGEGYMYQNTSNSIKQLRYTTKKSTTSTDSNSRSSKYWTVDATQYPSNMTMIAMTDVEGGDYEVAAFVNGELRGSSRPIYVESLDAHILILTISGDEVAEVTFKYYDIATGEEVEFSNSINYSNDAIVGSMAEPYMLTRGTTGIGEASLSEINIYPNPTTTGTEINLQTTCDKVEVFNALGAKVAEYHNVDSIDAFETAGIYVIRLTNNGDVKHCRLVVK